MTGIAKWEWMLKIYGEPESPQKTACLRCKTELANNIHTRDRMSGPSNSETVESRTFKLSNFRARNSADFRTFHLDAFQTFKLCKLSIFRTLKLANFHPFQTFDLWNIQTFELETFRWLKPSNYQTRDLSHKPQIESEANLSNSKPSNLRAFELSIFRTFKVPNRRIFESANFQSIEVSDFRTSQTFKVSNSQTSKADRTRPRQKFEVWVWSSQSSSKVRELERLKVWKFRVWKVRSLTPASLCIPRCTNFRTPALFEPSNLQCLKLSNFNLQTFKPSSSNDLARDTIQTLDTKPTQIPKTAKPRTKALEQL